MKSRMPNERFQTIRDKFVGAVNRQRITPNACCTTLHRRFKYLMACLLGAMALSSASAQTQSAYYVRPGASGSGNGSDWSNALTGLPRTLVRGATYYLADGSYGTQTLDTANSGTAVITIKKCTAADHGTSTGYSSSYCDGQASFGDIFLGSDYWVIDGATRNESNWADGSSYGLRIVAAIGSTAMTPGVCASNITFKYANIGGPENTSYTGSEPDYALKVAGFDEFCANWTMQRLYLHNIAHAAHLHLNGLNGGVVEYSLFQNGWGKESIRGQIALKNFKVRFNVFFNACLYSGVSGEGCTAEIAAWDGSNGQFDNIEVYGNIFRRTTNDGANGGVIVIGGNGSSWVGSATNNSRVYNNTIAGLKDGTAMILLNGGSGNVCQNNLWYDVVGAPVASCNISSNNTRVNTDPFISYSSGNFRLRNELGIGAALSSPYNYDLDGVARGSGNVWDVGAFEYGGTVSSGAVPAPLNLVVR